jgi:hypothetical protein
VNPVCLSLQFHLDLPGRKIIIHLLVNARLKNQDVVGPAQHAVCHYRLKIQPPGSYNPGANGHNHAMRAFEIYINGERLCLAGVSYASVFTAIIEMKKTFSCMSVDR